MASQANLAEIPNARKKQKIFGAMTTSRWVGVCIFLCGILYSYTSGPPLERLWRINPYFRDYRLVDRTSLRREGSNEVIDAVFGSSYFPATWFQQMGSHFGEVEQGTWNEREQKLYFVDSLLNKIFSYHVWAGLDIEYEFPNGTYPNTKNNKLVRPGPNGIAVDPKENKILYLSEPSFKRIVQFNLTSGKRIEIAKEYKGTALKAPYHLTVSPSKQHLYFTDPLSSSVYRVGLNKKPGQGEVELMTEKVKFPTHVEFSKENPNRVFVGNCVEGDYSVFVFDVDKSEKWTFSKEWNWQNLQWQNSTFKGKMGCVRGLTSIYGYLLVTCPGSRVCIINEETGVMKAVVKLFDGVILNDIVIGDNKIWMSSNYSFWRSYLYTGKKKTEL